MNYYDEIKNYVKKAEIGRAIREANANKELVDCYWNVGRLLVEAQGGKEKAKYGNELIKKWADTLSKEYGKVIIIQIYQDFANFILLFQLWTQCVHN